LSCTGQIGIGVKESNPCSTMPSNMANARRASRSWYLGLFKLTRL
jgi:hypothetical protein